MVVTELLAKFGLQVDKGTFAAADKQLESLGHAAHTVLGALGLHLALHTLTHFVHGLLEAGEAVHKMSIKVGMGTAAFQEYAFAADQADVSQESLQSGFKFLARSAFDAATGGKDAQESYNRLGVAYKDANGQVRHTEDLFNDVVAALSGVPNETERAALAMKVFGRGGAELLPLIAEGTEGIAALRKEARELGGGFDEEFIHNAKAAEDALKKFNFASESFKSLIGNAFLPAMTRGITVLLDWSKALNKILKGSEFVRMALLTLTAVTVAWGVASAIAARETILSWIKAAAPFLIIAAAVVAIGLALDDIHSMLTGGKSLVGEYIDEWMGIGTVDRFVQSWSQGVESLTNNLKGLVAVAGDAAGVFASLFAGDFGEAQKRMDHFMNKLSKGLFEFGDDVSSAVKAYGNTLSGTDTPADRAAGRGIGADLAGAEHMSRADGRGVHAKLAQGSFGFGQAAASSVSPFFDQDTQHNAAHVTGPGEATGKGANSVSIEQHNETHVTVKAETNASPEHIAQHAGRVVDEKLAKQNRNLKHALVHHAK